MTICSDVLVLGAGPAALCIVAELVEKGLIVSALASHPPNRPWPNTYGIWAEELESLGLEFLLGHRWSNTVSFFGDGLGEKGQIPTFHNFDYGLFDQKELQKSLLMRCGDLKWNEETAKEIKTLGNKTEVICSSGNRYQARIVIDASGHRSRFISRPNHGPVAQQAAYGVVGRFSSPPVEKEQFVLMDFRPDHLEEIERSQPPSFLYRPVLGGEIMR